MGKSTNWNKDLDNSVVKWSHENLSIAVYVMKTEKAKKVLEELGKGKNVLGQLGEGYKPVIRGRKWVAFYINKSSKLDKLPRSAIIARTRTKKKDDKGHKGAYNYAVDWIRKHPFEGIGEEEGEGGSDYSMTEDIERRTDKVLKGAETVVDKL